MIPGVYANIAKIASAIGTGTEQGTNSALTGEEQAIPRVSQGDVARRFTEARHAIIA
jgi:hypothetical protein